MTATTTTKPKETKDMKLVLRLHSFVRFFCPFHGDAKGFVMADATGICPVCMWGIHESHD